MSILLKTGKLISTSDIKLAHALGAIVEIETITHGETPEALVQSRQGLSFMLHGDYYELAAA